MEIRINRNSYLFGDRLNNWKERMHIIFKNYFHILYNIYTFIYIYIYTTCILCIIKGMRELETATLIS